MSDFVEDYINNCLNDDVSNMAEICKKAILERDEIDKKISEIKKLKERRDNLQKVLKSLNHKEGNLRKPKPPMVNVEISSLNDDPAYADMIKDICEIIDKYNEPITPSKIIKEIGYENEDPTSVYMSIKWLCEKGILMKNQDRTISKSKNWDKRL
jgi:histidinol phosphatase-like enzyme